jgi:hypothetical protein
MKLQSSPKSHFWSNRNVSLAREPQAPRPWFLSCWFSTYASHPQPSAMMDRWCKSHLISSWNGASFSKNELNIFPRYTNYFHLNTATISLATAAHWIGGAVAGLTYGQVIDMIGRQYALFWTAVMTLVSVVL